MQIFVLDEADRMLDMGFIRDIKRILKMLPQQRQNLMFSATYSDDIRQLANGFLRNPAALQVTPRNATADKVEQSAYRVPKDHKRHLLAHLIIEGNWHQVLVFTRTKHGANRLTQQLERSGINAMAIHGNKSQNARVKALQDFKENRITALVATEVAARGLDIKELPHVVNYELPNVPEDYVHRIGRTARAGSTGAAVSLVSPDESSYLRDIEKLLKRKIDFVEPPKFEIKEGTHHAASDSAPVNTSRTRIRAAGPSIAAAVAVVVAVAGLTTRRWAPARRCDIMAVAIAVRAAPITPYDPLARRRRRRASASLPRDPRAGIAGGGNGRRRSSRAGNVAAPSVVRRPRAASRGGSSRGGFARGARSSGGSRRRRSRRRWLAAAATGGGFSRWAECARSGDRGFSFARRSSGNRTKKVVPLPISVTKSSVPPWLLITLWAIDRPWPVPLPTSLVVKNGSKIRLRIASGMPPPVSPMLTTAKPSSTQRPHGDQSLVGGALHLVGDGVRGVDDEIQHHLVDLPAVAGHRRQLRRSRFRRRRRTCIRCAR